MNRVYDFGSRYRNDLVIEYEIVMKNAGDSHLSFELLGMPFYTALELVFCLVILGETTLWQTQFTTRCARRRLHAYMVAYLLSYSTLIFPWYSRSVRLSATTLISSMCRAMDAGGTPLIYLETFSKS